MAARANAGARFNLPAASGYVLILQPKSLPVQAGDPAKKAFKGAHFAPFTLP